MTTIAREQLKSAVSSVMDAAPSNAINDLFKNLWFVEDHICAYDGRIAMKHDVGVNASGGVPAKSLHAWVNACSGKDVQIESDGDSMHFRCGRAKLNLPMQDNSCMVFDWSTLDMEKVEWHDTTVAEAAAFCSPAMSDFSSKLELSGIMFKADGDSAKACATDDTVARVAHVDKWAGEDAHFPYRFAELMPHAYQTGVTESGSYISLQSNGAVAVAAMLDTENLGHRVAELFEKQGDEFSVPQSIGNMVARITAIHRAVEEDQRKIIVEGKNNKLHLSTNTTMGATSERVKCEGIPEFRVSVRAEKASRALADQPHKMACLGKHALRFDCALGSVLIATTAE